MAKEAALEHAELVERVIPRMMNIADLWQHDGRRRDHQLQKHNI